jgi:hypothetical protein
MYAGSGGWCEFALGNLGCPRFGCCLCHYKTMQVRGVNQPQSGLEKYGGVGVWIPDF